jgi:putative tryptophan/tyrosine transport system substrate-binding protein
MLDLRRRQFLTLLGGAAAAWPRAARAQHRERARRIGVLLPAAADDTLYQTWVVGVPAGAGAIGLERRPKRAARHPLGHCQRRRRSQARGRIGCVRPDVILAPGASTVGPLLQATRTVPIVFAIVADPVGAGFVESLARPGGNTTGFTVFEYGIAGKWLELLKQIAPNVTRMAVLRDPATPTGTGQFGAIQSVAPSLGVEVNPVNVRDAAESERAVKAFARSSNGGLIITASGLAVIHRDLLVKLAAQYRLPAMYFDRPFVIAGGLMSYGPDQVDQFRQAAGYVDRILRGEHPADLPVQAPTKFELVINLKTAKALGLTVPETLLARADEVIE